MKEIPNNIKCELKLTCWHVMLCRVEEAQFIIQSHTRCHGSIVIYKFTRFPPSMIHTITDFFLRTCSKTDKMFHTIDHSQANINTRETLRIENNNPFRINSSFQREKLPLILVRLEVKIFFHSSERKKRKSSISVDRSNLSFTCSALLVRRKHQR